MKVILAGYNVDSAVLEELKKGSPARDDVTPETLSASYARISRDPRPVDELRAAARAEVERARRSNQSIIFRMGHHSVAEHAVFNFDVIGVSRLAIEEIERFRLMSFTEKSQRYITLGEDFVVPEEVRQAGLEDLFSGTVKAQNALYHKLYARLKPFVFAKHAEAAAEPRNHAVLDGWAKEDARYIVSLATQGQLGLTANARSLELLIRRFAAKGLAELRELNGRLCSLAREVAPSIILFTEPCPFDAGTSADLEAAAAAWEGGRRRRAPAGRDVVLARAPEDGDAAILAALLHSVGRWSYRECLERLRSAKPAARRDIFRRALARMEFYDFPPREFEHADLVYDLALSASCFAQLKRHRMATLTWQRYDPALGVTVPPSVREAGMDQEFLSVIGRTNETHARLEKAVGPAADYVLTNAHRRRALLKVNVRELYHISRLRQDASAQWEIRGVAAEMSRLAARVMPLSCLLIGGKDAFPGVYARVFGRAPKMVPPRLLK
ncbi:MAG TPA: FAD-dependent thymidylate synthase [Candidatus Aminicenantes bacterium]|nr:FAD-dependent thymidylate synthase [Candidatus Aminicenantes bacterium]HRY66329.1 FAD-dependent thymidylate synthase [Candidatus Aminicenantes bacterium]HRZ73224.1 FAD-dependent thymidylate synthase [Candidatus Aminicenantes bacterium]